VPTAAELRELDDDELDNRLADYRRELLNLRFQIATGQLDNVTRVSEVRKDVARVLTVMRDREIALAEGRDAGPVPAIGTPRRRRVVEERDEEALQPTNRPRRSRRTEVGDDSTADDAVDPVDHEHGIESDADEVEDDDGAEPAAVEEES
jgi:large subunit ribosomal protein L29